MGEKARLIPSDDLQQHISEATTSSESRHNRNRSSLNQFHPYENFRTTASNEDTTISTVHLLKSDLRIVLVGKTGSGKSATGNTILGRKAFKDAICPHGVTKTCQRKERVVSEKQLSLVDTPGIFDKSMTSEKLSFEIKTCIEMSVPGPHVFLMIIRLDVRITDEEINAVKWIQENFGKDAEKHTIVLFTHADALEGKAVDEHIAESSYLQVLIDSCGGRYHSINNNDTQNLSQVTQLLEKIEKMLEENEGQHYSNDMFQRVQMMLEERGKFWSEKPKIVLLGKPGSGKSATGNTILRKDCFKIKHNTHVSVTQTCEQQEGSLEKKTFSVIDTPGLIDTSLSDKKVKSEIKKFVIMSDPGPHVFLLVIRLDERIADKEMDTARWIQENIGEDAARHTIVLFTHADHMEDRSLDEYIKEKRCLETLVNSCNGRYHAFDNENKYNQDQVTELLEKIEKMAESNEWMHYTNERFQKMVQRKIRMEKDVAQDVAVVAGVVGTAALIEGGVVLGVTMKVLVAPAVLFAVGGVGVVTALGALAYKNMTKRKI